MFTLSDIPGDRDAALIVLAEARRPVLVLGTDVWADRAEEAALRLVDRLGVPALTNGMGRGVVPARVVLRRGGRSAEGKGGEHREGGGVIADRPCRAGG